MIIFILYELFIILVDNHTIVTTLWFSYPTNEFEIIVYCIVYFICKYYSRRNYFFPGGVLRNNYNLSTKY